MTDNQALLPSGFHDVLPPQARQEAQLMASLTGCFESFGYELVRPPLAEFEETLLEGRGAALSNQTFRVMDPATRQMMGFRPDMTYQVARIARTRLANVPRPLRLAYAGAILHVSAHPLRSERQLYQAGFECIGAKTGKDAWESDAEAMLIAAESLLRLGIKGISIDINMPSLVLHFIMQSGGDASVAEAIRRKDAGLLPDDFAQRELVTSLLKSAGPAKQALEALTGKGSSMFVRGEAARIKHIVERLSTWLPEVPLTLDPLEHRGFEYHQGVSFSLFAEGLRHEAGRGGRYKVSEDDDSEAVGFTMDVTYLLGLLPNPPAPQKKSLPVTASLEDIKNAQKQGIVVVLG